MTTNTNTGAQTPATSLERTKVQSSAMTVPPGTRMCIQRNDGTIVPLIAVDELPESVKLKGVPATLTVLEAWSARMELIQGDHPVHGIRYQLDQPIKAHVTGSEQGSDSGSDGSPTSGGSQASDKNQNKNAANQTLRQPTLTSNDTGILDAMAKNGTIGKKVYCTYWIQTGNCNYMQEGCKYKHEIPKDEETRRAIGFREPPNWPREELPINTKSVPLLNQPWRRQDGKQGGSGGPGRSNRAASSPGGRTPNGFARGRSQASAGAPAQAHPAQAHPAQAHPAQAHPAQAHPAQAHPAQAHPAHAPAAKAPTANGQYNPNAAMFMAPQQHFPMQPKKAVQQANNAVQQRLFSPPRSQPFLGNGAPENYQPRPAQNVAPPPSYNQRTSYVMNSDHSDSSTPPKQPPISRPTNLGQSAVGQQNNTNASSRRFAPDHHIINQTGGPSLSGTSTPQNNSRPGYNGISSNWSTQAGASTPMDINFIAPSSGSARSGSQAVYTPNYTSTSTSATPVANTGNAIGGSNGIASSDARAGTPAHYNGNAFANNGINNGIVPVKGRGPVQFGRNNSPTPSNGSGKQKPAKASKAAAEESDATSVSSPPVMHHVLFREEGQPEYVSNPPEPKPAKATNGSKKHGKKSHRENGKSAKSKMSGNGYDLLLDVNDQH